MNGDMSGLNCFQSDAAFVETVLRTFFEMCRDRFSVESFKRRTFFSKLNRTDGVFCLVRRGCVRIINHPTSNTTDDETIDPMSYRQTPEAPREKLIGLLSAGMLFGDFCLRGSHIHSNVPLIRNNDQGLSLRKIAQSDKKIRQPILINFAEEETSSLIVVAERQSEIWTIQSNELLDMLQSFPELTFGIMKLLGRQNFLEQAHRVHMATLDVATRLAALILCLSDGYFWSRDANGCPKIKCVTQQDLADLIGASRSFVSSQLNQLKREGALNCIGHTIVVTGRDYLLQFIRQRTQNNFSINHPMNINHGGGTDFNEEP